MVKIELIADIVARDRRSSDPALYAAARDRTYSYFDLCNTAAKAGNVLRHVGVRPGNAVWIEPRPEPEPWLTCLGAAQLGAVVRFVGPHDAADGYLGRIDGTGPDAAGESSHAGENTGTTATSDDRDPSAVVVHAAAESAVDLPPGTRLVVYGDEPERTDATHWESEVWSENPAAPPAPIDASDPVVRTADATYSHRALVGAARRLVDDHAIDGETTVALRASLAEPRAVAGALTAPLVGGTLALPEGTQAVPDADLAVGDDGPEPRRIELSAVSLDGGD